MAPQKNVSAIRKLKSMYPLRAKVDESYRKGAEAVAAGKPAVWSKANWWQGSPILKALDLEVLYPENYGAVCAATGVAPAYLERADAAGFPTHLCGYARANFGYPIPVPKSSTLGEKAMSMSMSGQCNPASTETLPI